MILLRIPHFRFVSVLFMTCAYLIYVAYIILINLSTTNMTAPKMYCVTDFFKPKLQQISNKVSFKYNCISILSKNKVLFSGVYFVLTQIIFIWGKHVTYLPHTHHIKYICTTILKYVIYSYGNILYNYKIAH